MCMERASDLALHTLSFAAPIQLLEGPLSLCVNGGICGFRPLAPGSRSRTVMNLFH